MARVYLSCTDLDLGVIREGVAKALERFGHQPISMARGLAEDKRPLSAVRDDVGSCEVYIGIFAFRYGFVPPDPENTERLSITELELEHARKLDIPRLVFVLKENAPWPANMLDSQLKGGDQGERIARLRARLLLDRTVGQFSTASELEALVTASVTREVGGAAPGQLAKYSRQLRHHLLILCSPTDTALAQAWAAALATRGVSATVDSRSLLASNANDLLALDALLASHHAALVPVTVAMAGLVQSHEREVNRAVDMALARTDCLIAVEDGVSEGTLAGATHTLRAPDQASLVEGVLDALDTSCPDWRHSIVVGLPYSIVAMMDTEAEALATNLDAATGNLARKYEEQFTSLWRSVEEAPGGWRGRYPAARTAWRPLGGQATIAELMSDITTRLNGGLSGPRDDYRIRLQYYPFYPDLQRTDPDLRAVYATLERTGCVAIVDELSMFHPRLRAAALSFLVERQVSVITVAPSTPAQSQIEELLECEARKALTLPYTRFDEECDPQCELGIEGTRQLRRALRRSLPDAAQRIRQPGMDVDKKARLRAELGTPKRIADAIFPRRPDR